MRVHYQPLRMEPIFPHSSLREKNTDASRPSPHDIGNLSAVAVHLMGGRRQEIHVGSSEEKSDPRCDDRVAEPAHPLEPAEGVYKMPPVLIT